MRGIPQQANNRSKFDFSHPIDIPIHYQSLPEPDNTGAAVVEVVGTTFKSIVKNPNKDVFVNFYAPCTIWLFAILFLISGCPYSQRLAKTWDELGERLKSENSNLVIARMDGTQNEVPGKISNFAVRDS